MCILENCVALIEGGYQHLLFRYCLAHKQNPGHPKPFSLLTSAFDPGYMRDRHPTVLTEMDGP